MSRTLLQLCRAGIAALTLGSCEQVGVMFVGKEIAPDVISRAGEQDSWYAFLPEQHPGFCLRTTCTVIQTLPGRNIGYWSGFDSDSPGNIIMEARGNCLVIYPDYVWDGKSIGTTGTADLEATLIHDALYHALSGGACFSRREADRAYRAVRKRRGPSHIAAEYKLIRLFGWWSSRPHGKRTMIVRNCTPETPWYGPCATLTSVNRRTPSAKR